MVETIGEMADRRTYMRDRYGRAQMAVFFTSNTAKVFKDQEDCLPCVGMPFYEDEYLKCSRIERTPLSADTGWLFMAIFDSRESMSG